MNLWDYNINTCIRLTEKWLPHIPLYQHHLMQMFMVWFLTILSELLHSLWMEPYHGVQPQNLCLFCFIRLQLIKLPSQGQVSLPNSQLQWYYTICKLMWTKFVLKAFFDIALSVTTFLSHILFTSVDFNHKISWKFISFLSPLSAWHKNKQMSSMSGSFLWCHIIKSFW